MALTGQGALAQSVVVTTSTPSVDLSGATGASFGPDASTVIANVTNSGTDQATPGNAGVVNAATVQTWDNANGATTAGSISGAGIQNTATGNIGGLTNEGVISGRIGIDNAGNITSITDALGATIGTTSGGTYAVKNEAGATIGLLIDNGGLVVGASSGIALVDNAGTIGTLEEDGFSSALTANTQTLFLNEGTGTINQFTIGPASRIITENGSVFINLGVVNGVTVAGSVNTSGDAIVNGSTTNKTAKMGPVSITGSVTTQNNGNGGSAIKNYAQMGDVTESAGATLNGSTAGSAAIDNEAGAAMGNVTLDGTSNAMGYVVLNKSTMNNLDIAHQAMSSGDSVVLNTQGAAMGTFTTDPGSTTATTGGTNAVVENDGTMKAAVLNGNVSASNGVAFWNTPTGNVTFGTTIGGSVKGTSGLENDGVMPILNVTASGDVEGTETAGVELNNGTTAVTVDGTILGSGDADGLQVTGSANATITVEGSHGAVSATGSGNAVTVGPNASATINITGSGTVQSTGSAAVQTGLNTTINQGAGTSITDSGSGSAIVVPAGSNATVNATGLSAGALTIIGNTNATNTNPVIDVAGSATLNLDAIVGASSNGGAGPAITIESTGNVPVINATGFIEGAITNKSSNDLTINGNPNYTDGSTGGMGQMGVLTGGVAGQSSINNPNSNLFFGTGYVALDDTVNAPSTTVRSGGNLVASEPVTINGNFTLANGATFISQVQAGSTPTGTTSDTSYGRLLVNGNASVESGSALSLRPYTAYAFVKGQRFDLVSASGTGTYSLAGIIASAQGYSGTVTPQTVTQNGRTDLVVTLGDTPVTPPSNPSQPSQPSQPTQPSDPSTPPAQPSQPSQPSTPPVVHTVSALTQTSVASTNGILRYTGWNSNGLMNAENMVLATQQTGTARQMTQIGTQLAPVPHAQAGNAMLAIGDAAQGVVADRADAQRVAKQAGVATPSGVTTWGQAFGGAEQRGTTAGGTFGEVSGSNLAFGGLAVGVDKAVSPTWTAGGAFSYANGQSNATGDASGQHLSDNAFGLTFYQNWTPTSGRAYVDVSENASLHRFNESRSIDLAGVSAGSASGRFNGTSYGARVETGLPLALRNGIDVTPFVALGVQHLSLGSYTESDGGSGVGLNVNGASYTSVRTTVGVKVSKSFETKAGTVDVYLKPSLVHEFAGSPSNTTAVFNGDTTGETTFTTNSAGPVRNIADVSVGATLYRAKGLSLNAQVNVQAGSHYTGIAGGVQAKWSF
ncbi:autotransporter domain-containing protein [Paraburkholderia sp. BL21I4N1]|uniref:autotransporter outer membrane beta-barrel domain-containing protein n=1 Tax=Paraburkholderia sp. BL21I4N1 TaxID=1938801 RepID=UPI000CFC2E51|nr:autotransporter outer membrane beta-barrel domain-containing protein [Paraburkholderia sp. BL21I4N1]